ncbi:phosphatase domain-containing putative toxin [Pedosphaera parvula]|uniref:Uncharacterized protein n=1 Tax=Pedosphaera parvula (strain Ellin514) TaxID=320771 RepID=B9XSV8_PEDPL|nr:hypothetical protein [Pedosphaera parvula]EEF57067.1 hypothetical protein Cflav_PD0102 [Pedosphaera parvula Ellin514]
MNIKEQHQPKGIRGRSLFLLLTILSLSASSLLQAQSFSGTNHVPTTVHPLTAKGIENFFQLSDRFYSGSAPEGESAFAELKNRGIKTIITVDGAKPDVETAHRFGIRYVHLPIGYDGVPTNQAIRLVKAAETLPGPIYIHCHHGMHRGPAGAAVICMATEGWSAEQADSWLRLAGTATNYAGLYKSVEQFQVPTPEALKKVPANFPEQSPVSPLADVMIQIDERFENLKLIKKAGYSVPTSHPDLDPAHEALLLNELFKELLRSPATARRTQDFQAKLQEAEGCSHQFYNALISTNISGGYSVAAFKQLNAAITDATFKKVTDSCTACHKAHRN